MNPICLSWWLLWQISWAVDSIAVALMWKQDSMIIFFSAHQHYSIVKLSIRLPSAEHRGPNARYSNGISFKPALSILGTSRPASHRSWASWPCFYYSQIGNVCWWHRIFFGGPCPFSLFSLKTMQLRMLPHTLECQWCEVSSERPTFCGLHSFGARDSGCRIL